MNCKELLNIYKKGCENIENKNINMKYCSRILKIYFSHCNNINKKNDIYTKNDNFNTPTKKKNDTKYRNW